MRSVGNIIILSHDLFFDKKNYIMETANIRENRRHKRREKRTMEKHLLSGNEAIARGAYEAGVKVCSAYPGTPSTEIFESLPQYGGALYC